MIFRKKNKLLFYAHDLLNKGLFKTGHELLIKNSRYFTNIFRNSKTRSKYFFLLGAFSLNLGYYKRALVLLKRSYASSFTDKPAILFYLIDVCIKLHNYKKARYYFMILLNRNDSGFYIFYSYYLCMRNNISLDVSFERLKDLSPDSTESFYDLLIQTVIDLLDNKFNDAYTRLAEYRHVYNHLYLYNSIYLRCLFKTARYNELAVYFDTNTEYLFSLDALFIYCAMLYKQGHFDECLKVLNIDLLLRSESVNPLINTGKIYLCKKNYVRALKFFKKALLKSRYYVNEIYYYLSLACIHSGLLNEAVAYISKISAESSVYDKALFNLALIYYDLGKIHESREVFAAVDHASIDGFRYRKWENVIVHASPPDSNINIIKKIIYVLPLCVIGFGLIIFIFFYIIRLTL